GVMWMAIAAIAVFAAATAAARYSLLSRIPLTRPAAVLADRADEIRTAAGYSTAPVDRAYGFTYDGAYMEGAAGHGRDTARWTELANGGPAGVYFWYRTSPSLMLPFNQIGSVSMNDPPNVVNGMVRMAVDTNARLLQFEAAPPQLESTPAAAPAPADWSKMF